MSKQLQPSGLSEAQYEEIEAAVMESGRGRAFLKEFLARNRQADTMMLLDAISRLESALCLKTIKHDKGDEFTPALAEIASVVTSTRAEIASIRNDLIADGGVIPQGAEPFATAAEEAENLSTAMFAQVEQLENLAWKIRKTGGEDEVCDAIDACVEDLMELSWKQDVNGQRASKALNVLQYVIERTGGTLAGTIDDDLANEIGALTFGPLPEAEDKTKTRLEEAAYFGDDVEMFDDMAGGAPLTEVAQAGLEQGHDAQNEEHSLQDDQQPEPEEQGPVEAIDDKRPGSETEQATRGDADDGDRAEPPAAEDEDGGGHIVIIRTPGAPAANIPEPAGSNVEKKGDDKEVPLVSIPAPFPESA